MFIKKTYDLNIQINKQKLSSWKITLNINRKIDGTGIIRKLYTINKIEQGKELTVKYSWYDPKV